ncbi:protein takeout-like isoform X2 [Leptidea sinapis]|nr:protein takeout-like isoform X2 [Leptidea sinapis]
MNSIEELRPKMIKGIPELDVPGIEPLSLGQIALARGPQGAKLTAVVNDVKVTGPSNFKITELKSDLNKNRFDFKLLLPRLDFAGKYKMDIQILLLRLQGRGNITGSFKDYTCNVTMKGHKEMRDGNEYLNFDPMKVKLRVGESFIYLTNLFDGDPVLGPATNRVINDNSQVFLQEISPVLEKSLADIFTEMANKITSKFTYKELFP